ncbi:hypothetical protein U1Q18_034174 [Sarracenia purpurea var. burkii]
MAKNQTNTDSHGFCKKIFRAIRSFPDHPHPHSSEPHTEIPIHFNNPVSRQATGKGHNQEARAAPPNNGNNNGVLPTRVAVLEKAKTMVDTSGGGGGGGVSDEFSSYISRARAKVRASLNVGSRDDDGGGKRLARRYSINEKVSNFISSVKMKRRTKSSVGGDGRDGDAGGVEKSIDSK